MYNAVETALELLQRGAAINRMPNGKTPLHVACEVSNGDCVALLLAHGAKVNSLSLSGHTPLHYCTTRESVDCAKQLILKGTRTVLPNVPSSLYCCIYNQPNWVWALGLIEWPNKYCPQWMFDIT